MKIRIYRKDKSVPLPQRKTDRSIGLDVYAAEATELHSGIVALVPTGLIFSNSATISFSFPQAPIPVCIKKIADFLSRQIRREPDFRVSENE